MIFVPDVICYQEALYDEPWVVGTFGGDVRWTPSTGAVEPLTDVFGGAAELAHESRSLVSVATGSRL